jgi:hypothetical protein
VFEGMIFFDKDQGSPWDAGGDYCCVSIGCIPRKEVDCTVQCAMKKGVIRLEGAIVPSWSNISVVLL